MDAFLVRGSGPLSGTVRINGAKNSALKLMAAALLAPGTATLHNVPAIADIAVMADVLRYLGVTVTAGDGTYRLEVPEEIGNEAPPHLVSKLRASIVVLGPLLARNERVRIAQPGGCDLGNRNIDMHLSGLQMMGARIRVAAEHIEASVDRLVGADIELPFASVGATENLLMAAVTAKGTTRISNAAREPEISDLANFLRAMGAHISGDGTPEIVVHGTQELTPAEHVVVPDRIEAGTYAVAAAITGGELKIEEVVPAHLRLPIDKLRAAGVDVEVGERHLVVGSRGRLRAVDVVTLPYPGFPTDLQPQFLTMLSQAAGTSMLTENVFDGRFSFVEQLVRMGAEVYTEGHHAIVRGPRQLRGAVVRATDLRAGAALVLAGLVAEGETIVTEPRHVDRGYADLAGTLRALGADVVRGSVDVHAGAA
ncbi:MAG TPA: UDP-N-acetylglucosamine 1-carboxyvinyltransferase [Egibacteraceae bacterium]